jgi:hypothetical protein
MGETKASLLRFSLAYALRRVRLARHRLGLTEEQCYAVADETIREMRRFGGWSDLDEPVEPKPPAPDRSTASGM